VRNFSGPSSTFNLVSRVLTVCIPVVGIVRVKTGRGYSVPCFELDLSSEGEGLIFAQRSI